MNTVLIISRVALAGIFLLAALTKAADMDGSRAALRGFGVARSFVAPAAILLPITEALAAVMLIFSDTARLGAIVGLVLLMTFMSSIAVALRRGRAPECHCFGQLHSRPAGRETLGRNGILVAVALYVLVAGPGPALTKWASTSSSERVALAMTVLLTVLLAYACAQLWLENRRLSGRAPVSPGATPIRVGQRVPDFRVADSKGVKLRSNDLLAGAGAIVVFTSATCGPCETLLPELARWREMLTGRLAIHVMAAGDEEINERLAATYGLPILFDVDGSTAGAFGIVATPSAVEIDRGGHIAEPPAAGAPAIEALIRTAIRRPTAPVGAGALAVAGPSS